jgi:hypothetical protein
MLWLMAPPVEVIQPDLRSSGSASQTTVDVPDAPGVYLRLNDWKSEMNDANLPLVANGSGRCSNDVLQTTC